MRIIISFYTVKPNSVISDRKLKKHGRGPCFLLFSEPDFDDVVFALSCQGTGVVVGVAEGHGHDHFPFTQPVMEFVVGEEDVADPQASDAHGGSLEGHVFSSGADGLYVGKFVDFSAAVQLSVRGRPWGFTINTSTGACFMHCRVKRALVKSSGAPARTPSPFSDLSMPFSMRASAVFLLSPFTTMNFQG